MVNDSRSGAGHLLPWSPWCLGSFGPPWPDGRIICVCLCVASPPPPDPRVEQEAALWLDKEGILGTRHEAGEGAG